VRSVVWLVQETEGAHCLGCGCSQFSIAMIIREPVVKSG
jgi:hypothetical protein